MVFSTHHPPRYERVNMRTRYKVIPRTVMLIKMEYKAVFVLAMTSLLGLSTGFDYSDLVAMNTTCSPRDTCVKSGKRPLLDDSSDWKERNCFCDDLCADYGDCCLDANAYKSEEQITSTHNYQCVNLMQFGDLYMQGACMPGWGDLEIERMCSNGSPNSSSGGRDPMLDLPVTSLDTSITYTNFYCAVCNNDSTSLEMWKSRLECPTLTSYQMRFRNLTREYVASNLVFNDKYWGLYVNDNGVEVFHTCFIYPLLPETVVHMVRKCKRMIKTCASNWTDAQVEHLCLSYTAVVYNYDEAYRNAHCAKCNYVPEENTTCFFGVLTRSFSTNEFNPRAFALLFDFSDVSGSNVVGSACKSGEVFDPFFKKCRNVVCGKANQEYRFGRCVDLHVPERTEESTTTSSNTTTSAPPTNNTTSAPPTNNTTSVPPTNNTTSVPPTNNTTSVPPTTNTTSAPPTLTTEPSNAVVEKSGLESDKEDLRVVPLETTLQPVEEDGTTSPTTPPTSTNLTSQSPDSSTEKSQTLTCERFLLPADEFKMSANGTVVVEKYRRTYQTHEYERRDGGILVCIIQPEADKFSRLMGWVSLAGLGLSCVCLLVHLIAFLMVPDLRNLSGKNLASLCIVLLAAYATFILSVFGEAGKRECFILAAAMYYFFLSSFCWMSVMAFDIWRTLKLATSELRVSAGGQHRKFFVYSLYGWLLPAVALATLVTLDLVRPNGVPSQYFPTLGERWCWFGQRKALLVFFAAPLTTIMLMNIVLFILSARIIAETTQSTAKMTSCSPHQNQFKLYMRLALLMGLTWISGIVAGYLQLESIWYIFVLLNTLQGVFIFLAFTCTRKVWRVAGGGCWRRVVLARRSGPWVGRSPSSSRQGLESRDSHDSQLSHASHSSVTHLTSNSRTSVDAF